MRLLKLSKKIFIVAKSRMVVIRDCRKEIMASYLLHNYHIDAVPEISDCDGCSTM
jgi:hypothetical protein